MSKTLKCPMSPVEARGAFRALGREISEKCEFTIFLSVGTYREQALCAMVKAQGGYPADTTFSVYADSFEELVEEVRTKWADHSEEYARKTTDDMALEIIRITDAVGECSDSALRGDKFTYSDVTKFGVAACARAAEMASKGPFSIVTIGGANAQAA